MPLAYVLGLALTLTVVGGGDALARAAYELPPPRVYALRRTARLTLLFAVSITAVATFLVVLLIPASEQAIWVNAPWAGLAQQFTGPSWLRDVAALALAGAAVCVLLPAARATVGDAEQLLNRSVGKRHAARGPRVRPHAFRHADACRRCDGRRHHHRDDRQQWPRHLAGARLRHRHRGDARAHGCLTCAAATDAQGTGAIQGGPNLHLAGREVSLGLLIPGVVAGICLLAMFVSGDVAAIASAALIATSALYFTMATWAAEPADTVIREEAFDLLRAADLSLAELDARPGNVLVAVRNPMPSRMSWPPCRRQPIVTSSS